MKTITCNKKQLTQYHLYSATRFRVTGHFRPIEHFSQLDACACLTAAESMMATGQDLPEDAPLPPYQGYAYAHRSLFLQFRLKVNGFAASVLPRLGAGVRVCGCTAALLASTGVGEKFPYYFVILNCKRTLRSMRLRLVLLSDLLVFGAHALSRAPTSVQSGKFC